MNGDWLLQFPRFLLKFVYKEKRAVQVVRHLHSPNPTTVVAVAGLDELYLTPLQAPPDHGALFVFQGRDEMLRVAHPEVPMVTTSVQVTVSPTLDRERVIFNLSRLRQEWENESGGSLAGFEGSVGLLLWDVSDCIGLSEAEKALGKPLFNACSILVGA